ncbi:hypothetical protein HZB69_00470 [Candidatus Amesbacteria bacterium]|nr:hypothetical protein [Candidatus Amesbacteria bacterium]
MPQKSKVLGVLLLAIGLVVGLTLVNQKQNIFTKAWTGFTTNLDIFRKQPISTEFQTDPNAYQTKKLFHNLLALYNDSSEIQNIDIPEFNLKGVAFLKYDEKLKKTFVFTRIENLPYSKLIRLWLNKELGSYRAVGLVDFVSEQDKLVGYSVFVDDEDLRTYKELLFSYDESLTVSFPTSVALTLKF